MDQLAWHSTGNDYRRQPCNTAMAELQLVQCLSSLPSAECFIVLYLTNAGKAFAFPHQVVRIPFDEMRRYRVTNMPRGCCWGASKYGPSGMHRKIKRNGHRFLNKVPHFHPRQTWLELRLHVGGAGGVRKASLLKSNQLQSTKERGIAELFPQSNKKQMSQNTNTEPHPEREKNRIIYASAV